ncbi:MAG: response regulator [Proteobacteria bacterium]|nr:MAG: response regulator [Pseudomonadota bacterium]
MSKTCSYILVVEDDEDIRLQMTAVLKDEGYRVEAVENGRAALDHLLAAAPDKLPACIILDLMMPVMTGGQFLQIVRQDHAAQFGHIPVLVATAKGSPKEELLGLPAHIRRIKKPMELDEFLAAVGDHCGSPA